MGSIFSRRPAVLKFPIFAPFTSREPPSISKPGSPRRDFVARRGLRNYPGLLVTVDEKQRQQPGRRPRGCEAHPPRAEWGATPRSLPPGPRALSSGPTSESAKTIYSLSSSASMDARGRPLFFLERAAEMLRAIPEARFLWVGDGVLSGAWDEWIAEHSVGGRIQRVPWRNDLPLLLLAADAFLTSPRAKGLPLACSRRCRRPCPVSSRNISARDPTLTPTIRSSSIREGQWLKALHDADGLRRLGAAARLVAAEKFSCEKMAKSYEALYHETLAAAS